ncbi:MAG: FecCD family ABC transporter permease [Thermoleophilia bacterium]
MKRRVLVVLIVLPLLFFFISLFVGRYLISPATTLQVLLSKLFPIEQTWSQQVENVLFQIRMPRALLAVLVGAALSLSGASFQGMFRNPLVSPDILGVSSGAGFGAVVAIMFGGAALAIEVGAFVGGLVAVGLSFAISRSYKTSPALMLVLAGVVVGAFFAALISLLKFVADPYEKLPVIVFWLMGSFNARSYADVLTVIGPMVFGTALLLAVRWRINVLSMGDEQARSLGVNTETLKIIVIVGATLVTSASVAVSGIIGWVGLVIPHVTRMLVGTDHRVLLPATLSVGAAYMLLIDTLARTVTDAEIPLGILTAIVGAPFFAYLLRKTKGSWGVTQ